MTMCQLASAASPVAPSRGRRRLGQGGRVGVDRHELDVGGLRPEVGVRLLDLAASTGQMSLHGASKKVRTTTRGGCVGTETGWPVLVGQRERGGRTRARRAQAHEGRQRGAEGALPVAGAAGVARGRSGRGGRGRRGRDAG